MPAPVTLLMAIHCHQPVGNFGFVFEEAYAKAYDPFLEMLERHPRVRLALHYSGPLLDWLSAQRPEFLKRVKTLVTRGQIELLAGGYYEPILPLIPEADRQGQIAQLREALRRYGQRDARGLWLTERVWEPELPETLARAGIGYTMVDTNQFLSAKPWLPQALQVEDERFWDVCGSYTTEYAGHLVRLFPASKRLRYSMPFQPVEQTIEFLRRLRREEPMTITFADDGEKFGLWPKTHDWVYGSGWLEQFCAALEREREWLVTKTFQEYVGQVEPDGRVYLPCGSYEEMLEWSGGNFRNFFTKYPEANALYQKMLSVSRHLQEVSSSKFHVSSSKEGRVGNMNNLKLETRNAKLLREAQQALYAGQCNCAYWHGVFGGLYLSHLRGAVYAQLLAAEQLALKVSGVSSRQSRVDADGDGREELCLTTPTMNIVVDPAEGGSITEWSVYGPRLNLFDTLTRRHEPYHDRLLARHAAASAAGAPASIHDLLQVKEEHLDAHLLYDDHRRSGFLDYALQRPPTLQDVIRSTWAEQRLWSPAAFHLAPARRAASQGRTSMDVTLLQERDAGRVRKSIRLFTREPRLECRYELDGLHVPVVAIETTLALRDPRYLTQPQEHAQVTHFEIEEPERGVRLRLVLDPPATLIHVPIETVSGSEEGLERTYQGLGLLCVWTTGGAAQWTSRLQWNVETR